MICCFKDKGNLDGEGVLGKCLVLTARHFQMMVVFCLALVFMTASPARAHKVYVFAWAEKGMVFTESSFSDKKVRGGSIKVLDDSGRVVVSGTTDNEGNFSFPVPADIQSGLEIRLDASMGHQAVWHISEKELHDGADPDSGPSPEVAAARKELAKGPGILKILAGIGIIFSLAGVSILIRKKRRKSHG